MSSQSTLYRWGAIVLAIALFSWKPLNLGQLLFAQESGPSATTTEQTSTEAPAAENPESDTAYLAEAGKFHLGDDPAIWIMFILFILAVAVTIERSWVLYKNKGNNAELVSILAEELDKNPQDTKALEEKVIDARFGLEGRVAGKTLKGWNYGEHTMNEYSQTSLIAERRFLEKRLVILSTLGNNVPFIGLLGTVMGIMKAFRDLALSGDGGPSVVMKGISEALIATAMGLGVAIPVVIAFNALNKFVQDKLSSAEEITTLMRAIRLSKDKES